MAACTTMSAPMPEHRHEPYLIQVLHDNDRSAENRYMSSRQGSSIGSSQRSPLRSTMTTPLPEPPSPIVGPTYANTSPHASSLTQLPRPTYPLPPSSHSAPTSQNRRTARPTAPATVTPPRQPVVYSHNALYHYCELHETPFDLSPVPEPLQQLNGLPKVFIGQLPREMCTQHVRWMLRDLIGVTPYDVRVAGAGCFVMQMMSQSDAMETLNLNRHVLYDAALSYWYARTPQQQEWLMSYADNALNGMRGGRLPTNCVVVEWATERRATRRFY